MSRQTNLKILNVVALVLENHQGEILVAKRAAHKHLGGMWEFPGGKVEADETQLQALKREIKEEIDFYLPNAQPLILTTHTYETFALQLDVWYHKALNPKINANEGQPLKWIQKSELLALGMPAADDPIINAILDL